MSRHVKFLGALCVLLWANSAQAQEVPVSFPVLCAPVLDPYDGEANSKAINLCGEKEGIEIHILIPYGGPFYIRRTISLHSRSDHRIILRSAIDGVKAQFIADPELDKPVLVVDGTDFVIYDLEVSGNKYKRDYSDSSPLELCRRDDRRPANIEVSGERFQIFNVITKDAPCGSGLGVFGKGVFYVFNVTAENNGWPVGEWPFLPVQYADGITVVICNGGYVYNNTLRENTDFDLLFGGGKCVVTGNYISHDYVFGFGGINVGHMKTGMRDATGKSLDGNHAGSFFGYNTVVAKRNKLMYGMSLGSHPFTFDVESVKVFDGGTFIENSSSGAQINFIIDGVDKADVRRNRFANAQGDRTEFNACAVAMNYGAGHLGFTPQDGFVSMTMDAGRALGNKSACRQ